MTNRTGLTNTNLLMMVDSYKVSHWLQFPEGMDFASYYVESRGGKFDETMVAGIRYLREIISQPITMEDVEEAKSFYEAHFGMDIFPYEIFKSLVEEQEGRLDKVITILAAPEGTVIPTKNAIAVIEAGGVYAPLVGYFETLILRSIWYPTTVATISYQAKKVINRYLNLTSDLTGDDYEFVLNTRLHDFGARGVSSSESCAIGGLAHLYNFIGSDSVEAIVLARNLYGATMAGISIPAREHSTTTSWVNETDAFKNSIEKFGTGVYACVMDSYDYTEALKTIGTELKARILEQGGTFVARPDSGIPVDVVMEALESLGETFGYEYNSKGYKVLHPSIRVIQGDGVDINEIQRILAYMETRKWSAENVAFGMGGGLLQHCDRDTQRFAMKMSYCEVNGVGRDVFKAPKTDPSKASKKGQLDFILHPELGLITSNMEDTHMFGKTLLNYTDRPTLDQIRNRANRALQCQDELEAQFV